MHVSSFFQATSHDQLGDPWGGYTCPCYAAENTTYDVNQSAMEWCSRQAFQKIGMLAPRLLFCRYQGFVEQHQDPDPQVEDGRIMGSALCMALKTGKKKGVFYLPLFCRSPTDSSCTFTALRRRAADCFRMGRAFLHGAEDRQKIGLFCLPLFCRLGIKDL